MKNGKPIQVYTLAFALMLLILLSSMIGTIVWAGKPDKPPGKPSPPEPEIADFKIEIGLEDGDDIVLLEPTHEDGIYLYKEDVPYEDTPYLLWDRGEKVDVQLLSHPEVAKVISDYTKSLIEIADEKYIPYLIKT